MDIATLFSSMSLEHVKAYVTERREENLHLEFKQVSSTDLSNADDRRNFATALSGFANSDGGLIVWGIKARRGSSMIDCAQELSPIANGRLFLSKLNDLTGEAVSPIVPGVQHRFVPDEDGQKGYVITMIPASDTGPHMAKSRENRYYKRSGDSFYMMEHFDIEDMFGRRRKPTLSFTYWLQPGEDLARLGRGPLTGEFGVVVGIRNTGRGVARFPALELSISSPYSINMYGLDGNRREGLPRIPSARPATGQAKLYGGGVDHIVQVDSVLEVTLISHRYSGKTPFIPLSISWRITAEGIRPQVGTTVIEEREVLESLLPASGDRGPL